jgi:hypothetical protein
MQRARQPSTTVADRTVPDLDAGLTVLRTPHHRSSALHRVALQAVRQADGPAYWIDARNTAATYALFERAPSAQVVERVRIARAFTAYQHQTLVERVVNRVTPRTGCLIVPNVASLYRDDDVPAYETEPLLEAATAAVGEVGTAYDIPVLATLGGPDDEAAALVAEHARAEITCEETALGYRFAGDDFETDIYWTDDHWQTTIPYWVDLLDADEDGPERSLTGPALQFAVEG